MTNPEAAIRLALVDDEEMVRQGLATWLRLAAPAVEVCIATPSWADLLAHPLFPVDVVLLDFELRDGVPAQVKVATLVTVGVPCIIVSTHATPAEVAACITAGARGYLPKSDSPEEIVRAARAAADGGSYVTPDLAALLVADREQTRGGPRLSPQELRALTLYAGGLPMKSVANRLGVGYETAKSYIDRVREKYEVAGRSARTKVELYQRAVEDGLV